MIALGNDFYFYLTTGYDPAQTDLRIKNITREYPEHSNIEKPSNPSPSAYN